MTTSTVHTFKASLDKSITRTFQIRSTHSLYQLAAAIVTCFDFELDHAFGFYDNLKDIYKSKEIYELFTDMGADPTPGAKGVKKTKVSDVFMSGKKMCFHFDYGDDWQFMVKCLSVDTITPKTKYPFLKEKHGKAPEQYPQFEE